MSPMRMLLQVSRSAMADHPLLGQNGAIVPMMRAAEVGCVLGLRGYKVPCDGLRDHRYRRLGWGDWSEGW